MMLNRFIKYLPLCLIAVTSNAVVHANQSVQISTSDGMIWVQASNVTARTFAQELSTKLDISVVLTGNADARLDIDISDEPLAEAVSKMSPNNLVVRENADPDSDIVEVILMISDSSAVTGNDEQFLPTGAPGSEIVSGDHLMNPADAGDDYIVNPDEAVSDPALLRDPNRALQARQAADAATYDAGSLPPDQVPPMFTQDLIDPPTTLPPQ